MRYGESALEEFNVERSRNRHINGESKVNGVSEVEAEVCVNCIECDMTSLGDYPDILMTQ